MVTFFYSAIQNNIWLSVKIAGEKGYISGYQLGTYGSFPPLSEPNSEIPIETVPNLLSIFKFQSSYLLLILD